MSLIITGASGGIGKELARIASFDTPVLNVSRNPCILENSSSSMLIQNIEADLSELSNIAFVADEIAECLGSGKIRCFVSNAASTGYGNLLSIDPSRLERTINLNVSAPILLISELFRRGLFAREEAKIVLVTSSLAKILPELTFSGMGLYGLTKAAISRLTLYLKDECTPHGVGVCSVHPGIVFTQMQIDLRSVDDADQRFIEKNEQLPMYARGEWRESRAADTMRTVMPEHSADFLNWILATGNQLLLPHYDFYECDQYHEQSDFT